MIDLKSEHIISLRAAAALLPTRRAGKRVHVSCVYRWTVTGCRGICLDSVQVGATRCTSTEALDRFILALTDRSGIARSNPTVRETPARSRSITSAEAELARDGI